jgi:TfoX/Sxy family transcriptional regulator of competence genes
MAKKAMPKWRPAPDALKEQFARACADLPQIESRKMFGYPAIFLNGNMVAGLFQDQMIVRLSEGDRERLAAIPGAARFEPMPGRPMREYMVLPASIVDAPARSKEWLERARSFVGTLPPKQAKGAKKAAKKPAASKRKR